MRISDWSSDVCSSDLQAESSLAPIPSVIRTSSNLTGIFLALSSLPEGCGGRGAASGHARFAAGVVVVRAAPVLDEVAQPLVRSLRPHDAQLPVLVAAIDLKSVMSGKSVCVRCSLGGARCIKK